MTPRTVYTRSLSQDIILPFYAEIAPADEQALLDLAAGRPAGADIHKRYEYTDRRAKQEMSCNNEGHEERMRYHMQRVAGNI